MPLAAMRALPSRVYAPIAPPTVIASPIVSGLMISWLARMPPSTAPPPPPATDAIVVAKSGGGPRRIARRFLGAVVVTDAALRCTGRCACLGFGLCLDLVFAAGMGRVLSGEGQMSSSSPQRAACSEAYWASACAVA